MKYLIVMCTELGDQWECDANRKPICITDNPDDYGLGYEVYEIKEDGTLKLIKGYEDARESGMAVYAWKGNDDHFADKPKVYEKYSINRYQVTKSMVKRLKKIYHFSDTVDCIYRDIAYCGAHGETINKKWVVFGEYSDNHFTCGY